MSPDRCCESPRPKARRGLELAGSVVPAEILVLLPKCPACIAAYLALGAGIGVAVSTAAYLRILLVAVCVMCLAWVAARHVRRWIARDREPAI